MRTRRRACALLGGLVTTLVAALLAPITTAGIAARATAAGLPVVSVGDAAAREGNTGAQKLSFVVTLSEPTASTVSARFVASDGTALTSTGGADFTKRSTTVRFDPGQLARTVTVTVYGDTWREGSGERFVVSLERPKGVALGRSVAAGRILDDDDPPSSATDVSVSDVGVVETSSGATYAPFTVSLGAPATTTAMISYATEDGTATNGGPSPDYDATSGSVVIPSGSRSASVVVPVRGDTSPEGDETFALRLTGTDFGTIVDDSGAATIGEAVAYSSAPGPLYSSPGPVFEEAPSPFPNVRPGDVIWASLVSSDVSFTTWRVLYASRSTAGEMIGVVGSVVVPTAAPPAGGRKVVAWAEGTTGLADSCPPGSSFYLSDFVARGYTVVNAGYEGLTTPGPHPYLHTVSEAHTVLDAIRAARDMDAGSGVAAVVLGASRGGHAAVAAGELAKLYTPELKVKGVVGSGAGVVDASEELADYTMTSGGRGMMMMALQADLDVYPTSTIVDRYLTPTGLAELPNTLSGCVVWVVDYFNGFSPSTLFNLTRPPMTAEERAGYEAVAVGSRPRRIPALLVHGTADPVVPASVASSWANRHCTRLDVRWYAGAGHVPWAESQADVLAWIDARFANIPPPTTCSVPPIP